MLLAVSKVLASEKPLLFEVDDSWEELCVNEFPRVKHYYYLVAKFKDEKMSETVALNIRSNGSCRTAN